MRRMWSSLRAAAGSRREDERGATFILTAICMVVLLWGGAVGVDLGLTVATGRQTQAISDTAALDMTRYIDMADAQTSLGAANTYLATKLSYANTDNGTAATLTDTPGLWSNGAFTANGSGGCYYHFPVLGPPCNAVQVTASESVPQVFVAGRGRITRSSIAAVTPEATFSIGTYLANVNTTQSSILNLILGALGGSANISLADYNGMANTYVSLNQLITASAGVLTDSNVMTTALPASTWQTIWYDAVSNVAGSCSSQTPACESVTGLSSADLSTSSGSSTTIALCQLVKISTSSSTNGSNALGCSSGNLSSAALTTQLNVFQTLETEAEMANGSNGINVQSVLGITNVLTDSLQTDVISPPVVAIGAVGTEAQTSQVQASLNLGINIAGTNYTVGISAEGAAGTATLATLTCTNNTLSDATIQPAVTTLSASNSAVTVGGISLPGYLSVSGYSGSTVGFTSGVVPPTAATASGTTPSNPRNVGTYSPTVTINAPTGTPIALNSILATLTDSIAPVFQAAGVTFGGANVADLSTNCGAVSLVK
jgi:uncharacterized membrane protein